MLYAAILVYTSLRRIYTLCHPCHSHTPPHSLISNVHPEAPLFIGGASSPQPSTAAAATSATAPTASAASPWRRRRLGCWGGRLRRRDLRHQQLHHHRRQPRQARSHHQQQPPPQLCRELLQLEHGLKIFLLQQRHGAFQPRGARLSQEKNVWKELTPSIHPV